MYYQKLLPKLDDLTYGDGLEMDFESLFSFEPDSFREVPVSPPLEGIALELSRLISSEDEGQVILEIRGFDPNHESQLLAMTRRVLLQVLPGGEFILGEMKLGRDSSIILIDSRGKVTAFSDAVANGEVPSMRDGTYIVTKVQTLVPDLYAQQYTEELVGLLKRCSTKKRTGRNTGRGH